MRRVSTLIALAGLMAGLTASGAAAGTGRGTWQPYRTQAFDSPDDCPFVVHGDIVRDEEEVRTDATYPDGSPRVQEYRGPLVIRFTNVRNGRSVVRDVSGYALLRFAPDGGSDWFFDGGGSIGVPVGNRTTPPGSYVLHGRFVLRLAADGTRTIHREHATMEDLCTTLA